MLRNKLSEESKVKWTLFLSGDNDAYEWLYNTYSVILYAYGHHFTDDGETISDAIQEVFTTIYRSRAKIVVPDNVRLYLMVSLKNTLIRIIQKKIARYAARPDDPLRFILEPTVEEQYIKDEESLHLRKKVEKIISTLTPRQKEIIYYRYIQEFDLDEICKLMELNHQSAKNLIHRAMEKIRREFAGDVAIFLTLFILFFPDR